MSWPQKKLSEIAPSNPHKFGVSSNDTKVLHINLDQIESGTGRLIQRIMKPISEAGNSTHGFNNKHVLYSKLRPYLNKVLLPEEIGLCTTELVPMLPNEKLVDRNYIAHYLKSKNFVDWISNQTAGAKMPRVSMDKFWDHEIPVPPLTEQKRIAAILDKADSISRKRQQAIKLADEFLRAVFLEMFGDPVTNPKGWTVSKFSELGEWKSGGTPSRTKPEYFTGDIDWYSAGELNSRYLHGSVEKISKFAVDNSSTKIFQKGSILLGMYDTAAFKSSILINDAASNQACANLLPNERVNVEWLYDYIQISKENYLKLRRGVRQKNLNLGMIKDFELNLPPMEEQIKYVAFISKFNQACEKNELFKTSSENLFDSISQKAFSGEL